MRAFIFLLLSFSFGMQHPYYMSITQIDENAKAKTLEVAVKVFSEDLESVLEKLYKKQINIHTAKELEGTNDRIAAYIAANFSIESNHKKCNWRFIGKEKEDDATWIYIEFDEISAVSSLKVTNTILTELHESQNNIVHIAVNHQSKSYLLSRNKPFAEIQY